MNFKLQWRTPRKIIFHSSNFNLNCFLADFCGENFIARLQELLFTAVTENEYEFLPNLLILNRR